MIASHLDPSADSIFLVKKTAGDWLMKAQPQGRFPSAIARCLTK